MSAAMSSKVKISPPSKAPLSKSLEKPAQKSNQTLELLQALSHVVALPQNRLPQRTDRARNSCEATGSDGLRLIAIQPNSDGLQPVSKALAIWPPTPTLLHSHPLEGEALSPLAHAEESRPSGGPVLRRTSCEIQRSPQSSAWLRKVKQQLSVCKDPGWLVNQVEPQEVESGFLSHETAKHSHSLDAWLFEIATYNYAAISHQFQENWNRMT